MATEKKFKLGPNQRKWLRALKSGKYKQGRKRLCKIEDGEKYHCCLGVAAEVCGMKGELIPGVNFLGYGYDVTLAPPQVIDAFGLVDNHGLFTDRSGSLTRINDSKSSYAPIIKLIETKPELIFTKSV